MKAFLTDDCGVSSIKVICVIRKPFEYLNSMVQQYIKPGLVTLDDLCDGCFPGFAYHGVRHGAVWDYHTILDHLYFSVPERLINVFGSCAVQFLEMDTLKDHSSVRSVLIAAGLENHVVEEPRMNSSMSHEACILLSEYNNRYPLFSEDGAYNPRRQQPSRYVRFLRMLPGERPSLLNSSVIDPSWSKGRIKKLNVITGRNILDPDTDHVPQPRRRDLFCLSERTVTRLNRILGYKGNSLRSGSFTRDEISKLGKQLEHDYSTSKKIVIAFKRRIWFWH